MLLSWEAWVMTIADQESGMLHLDDVGLYIERQEELLFITKMSKKLWKKELRQPPSGARFPTPVRK